MKSRSFFKERETKFKFETVEERRFYLERMAAACHNELVCDDSLKPMDKSRYFNILIQSVKLCHEMQTDASLEDLEKRLEEIEQEYEKIKGK